MHKEVVATIGIGIAISILKDIILNIVWIAKGILKLIIDKQELALVLVGAFVIFGASIMVYFIVKKLRKWQNSVLGDTEFK